MNAKKAKKLRKQVYGDLSLKDRKYYELKGTGQILTDTKRQDYQRAKRHS